MMATGYDDNGDGDGNDGAMCDEVDDGGDNDD